MTTDNGTSGHFVQRCFFHGKEGYGLIDEDVSRRTIAVSIKASKAHGAVVLA